LAPAPAQTAQQQRQKARAAEEEATKKKQLEEALRAAGAARHQAQLQRFIAAEQTAAAEQQRRIAEERTRTAQRLAQTVAQTEMARRHALEQRLKELQDRTTAPAESSKPPVSPAAAEPSCCVVCLEAPKVVAFQPCGHVVTCNDCAARLLGGKCPICRANVASLLRVFL
jgi:hypothetical protein